MRKSFDHDRANSSQAQAWFDNDPVKRLRAFIDRLGGVEIKVKGKPCGRNLNCPMCQKIKDTKNINIPTNMLKIDIGRVSSANPPNG